MGNQQRYVHTAVRRFYGANWIQLCDLLKISPQTYGAFNSTENMIGLQLPRQEFGDEKIGNMVRSLRLVYSTQEESVEIRCYLHGTRYYKFVFFESTIAVSEDTHENVRQSTNQTV